MERANGKQSQREAAAAPTRRQRAVVHPGREMPWPKAAEFMAKDRWKRLNRESSKLPRSADAVMCSGESEWGWLQVKGFHHAANSYFG